MNKLDCFLCLRNVLLSCFVLQLEWCCAFYGYSIRCDIYIYKYITQKERTKYLTMQAIHFGIAVLQIWMNQWIFCGLLFFFNIYGFSRDVACNINNKQSHGIKRPEWFCSICWGRAQLARATRCFNMSKQTPAEATKGQPRALHLTFVDWGEVAKLNWVLFTFRFVFWLLCRLSVTSPSRLTH